MKFSLKILSVTTLAILIALPGCKEKDLNPLSKLDAKFFLSPENGLTTTEFNFDIGGAMNIKENVEDIIFIRFDWDADGEWDMMYSTIPEHKHRYYQPGEYKTIMEVSRANGETDTISCQVKVEQGYSSPQPKLIIEPDSGNILTEFTFDGSLTHDDEDSLETLLFRWDFNGDGDWDTDFQSAPIVKHFFKFQQYHEAIMEVKDTMDLIGRVETPIVVNLLNDKIKPKIELICEQCTIEDEFILDASKSYEENKEYSPFLYSWDVNNDIRWDVRLSEDPVFRPSFGIEGSYPIRLRVTSSEGLYRDTVFLIDVHPKNTPPLAILTLSSHIGNLNSEFYFTSKGSDDRDEGPLTLKIRWDINGDGEWDTDFNDQIDVYHKFAERGTHVIKMSITDSGEKETIATDSLMIFEGSHETDFIIETRGIYDKYYGTVKIGNQWWMQENLDSEFIGGRIPKKCYSNNPQNCHQYGGLYYFNPSGENKFNICPEGWRVAGVEDWKTLMEYLKEDQFSKLNYGGSSEFHIRLGGYYDISNNHVGLGEQTHFWTGDITTLGNPIAWHYYPKKQITQKVFAGHLYMFYVRCIKE